MDIESLGAAEEEEIAVDAGAETPVDDFEAGIESGVEAAGEDLLAEGVPSADSVETGDLDEEIDMPVEVAAESVDDLDI